MTFQLEKLSDFVKYEFRENEKLQEGFLRAHWEDLMEKYAKYCEIFYFSSGILSIKIQNSIAVQHMYMNKNKILKMLNEKIEKKEFQIYDIQWIVEGKR